MSDCFGMTDLARVGLGVAPTDLARTRIGPGWDPSYPLRDALDHLHLEDGTWWTWAPPGSEILAPDLEEGRLPPGVGQHEVQEQALEFVSEYLAEAGRLALLEDWAASPSDPWITKDQPPAERFACGTRLYWYATEPAMVRPMLLWGGRLFCCVVLAPVAFPVTSGAVIDTEQVRALGSTADHFLLDAFDFEGYVVWSRSATSIGLGSA